MVSFKWIPLANIVGSIYQPRLQEDRELRSLAESILLNGLLTPVTVVTAKGKAKAGKGKAGGATYLMRSGHRRKKALELLIKRGVTSIPAGHARIEGGQADFQALIRDDVTAKEAIIAALIDNLEREPLTPYEQACALRTLAEEKQIDRQDLARRAQIHPDTVDYMIAALDPKYLPLPMIKSWKQGRLDMGHVRALIRLRTYKKRQKQLYSKILKENLSVTEARFWCNRLLDKGDIPLERRTNALMADRFLKNPLLKKLIDDKQLNVRPSVHGDQLTIKVDGTKAMRETCLAIANVLKGLDL